MADKESPSGVFDITSGVSDELKAAVSSAVANAPVVEELGGMRDLHPVPEDLDLDEEGVRDILNRVLQLGLGNVEQSGRVVRCPLCDSLGLRMDLTCATCDSTVLLRGEGMEHIQCGHQAFAEGFQREHGTVCPGCGVTVMEEGEDHRTLGPMTVCSQGHIQGSQLKSRIHCTGCDHSFPIEEGEWESLYSFTGLQPVPEGLRGPPQDLGPFTGNQEGGDITIMQSVMDLVEALKADINADLDNHKRLAEERTIAFEESIRKMESIVNSLVDDSDDEPLDSRVEETIDELQTRITDLQIETEGRLNDALASTQEKVDRGIEKATQEAKRLFEERLGIFEERTGNDMDTRLEEFRMDHSRDRDSMEKATMDLLETRIAEMTEKAESTINQGLEDSRTSLETFTSSLTNRMDDLQQQTMTSIEEGLGSTRDELTRAVDDRITGATTALDDSLKGKAEAMDSNLTQIRTSLLEVIEKRMSESRDDIITRLEEVGTIRSELHDEVIRVREEVKQRTASVDAEVQRLEELRRNLPVFIEGLVKENIPTTPTPDQGPTFDLPVTVDVDMSHPDVEDDSIILESVDGAVSRRILVITGKDMGDGTVEVTFEGLPLNKRYNVTWNYGKDIIDGVNEVLLLGGYRHREGA